jgi:hypothetical protein
MIKKNNIFVIEKDLIQPVKAEVPKFSLSFENRYIDGQEIAEQNYKSPSYFTEKFKNNIIELKQQTGCSLMRAKKVLIECDGDFDKALEYIRKYGDPIITLYKQE